MSKLIIINGASGSGKTFLLEAVARQKQNIVPIKKYTTRQPRDYEKDHISEDLHFNSTENYIRSLFYNYRFNNEWYGIDKQQIDITLRKEKYPIVIVRDYDILIKLRHDYNHSSLAFYIQGIYSDHELRKKLLLQGRDPKYIAKILRQNKANFDAYIEHLQKDLFDRCIFNYYDETFLKQFAYFVGRNEKREIGG